MNRRGLMIMRTLALFALNAADPPRPPPKRDEKKNKDERDTNEHDATTSTSRPAG